MRNEEVSSDSLLSSIFDSSNSSLGRGFLSTSAGGSHVRGFKNLNNKGILVDQSPIT